MPSQSSLVMGAEYLARQETPPAPHSGRGAPHSGVRGPTAASDPSSQTKNHKSLGRSDNRKSLQIALQPGQVGGPQPKPGVPTVSAALEGGGDRGKGAEAAQTKKHHCGVCGDLLLAVVLVVFSPLLAVGVCVADIVTGEFCKAQDTDSVDEH